jgi:hypothetical protein
MYKIVKYTEKKLSVYDVESETKKLFHLSFHVLYSIVSQKAIHFVMNKLEAHSIYKDFKNELNGEVVKYADC